MFLLKREYHHTHKYPDNVSKMIKITLYNEYFIPLNWLPSCSLPINIKYKSSD